MAMMTMAAEVLANHGGPGGWWPIFPIFWVLFWGVLIFAVFRFRRGGGRWNAGQSPVGVLGERFARGEISEDEYRERLKVLKEIRS